MILEFKYTMEDIKGQLNELKEEIIKEKSSVEKFIKDVNNTLEYIDDTLDTFMK